MLQVDVPRYTSHALDSNGGPFRGLERPTSMSALRPKRLFRDYPALADASLRRAERYNATLSFIESPPPDCTIRVIGPPTEFAVGRLTRKPELLEQGYQEGHQAGLSYLEGIHPCING